MKHFTRAIAALSLVLVSAGLAGQPIVRAAPVAPALSIIVTPTDLLPAQAGYVYVGGAYPLEVTVTLDGAPLEVFWGGDGYLAMFAFGFDAPAGTHSLAVEAVSPITGQHAQHTATITVADFRYPLEQVALPYKLIPLLARDLNENELARLDAIYAGHSTQSGLDWPFALPVPGGIITSRFGGDRIYNGGLWAAHHTGIDFRRAVGEPVQATADGRVAAAEFFDVRGNVVIIDHGHGIFSQYAHLSEFYVQPGQVVSRGQLIGAAGATGRTNGPHLHFEVIVNGIPIDPVRWFALAPAFVPPREVNPQDSPPSGP